MCAHVSEWEGVNLCRVGLFFLLFTGPNLYFSVKYDLILEVLICPNVQEWKN